MSRWTPEKVAELLRRADAATTRADELVVSAREVIARADEAMGSGGSRPVPGATRGAPTVSSRRLAQRLDDRAASGLRHG